MRWTHQLFKEKLKELYPNLILESKFVKLREYVYVRDNLDIVYKILAQGLLKNFPTIKSAVDKTDAFIKFAKNIHGDKYDYSRVKYVNCSEKVEIICPIHGVFTQTPSQHIHVKHGCNICLNTWALTKEGWITFTQNKSCVLYIINCYNNSENFIKLGITSNSVESRFFRKRDMPYEYDIIFEYKHTSGEFIWELEQYLHDLFWKDKYKPLIKFGGSGECYNFNILLESLKVTKEKINEYLYDKK